jgi:WD40 repeat protein
MEGFWLTAVNDATRISINRKSEKVAVGCSSGEVIVFTLDDYSFLRLFTMSHWGLAEEDTGAVSCLEWTPEGSALAVGYASRGLSVWSLYGCRLHSTIPNQPIKDEKVRVKQLGNKPLTLLQEDSDGNKIHSREVLSKGVSHLAWGPEGYHLIATSFETDGLFTQFSFVKSCLANTPNMVTHIFTVTRVCND